MKSKLFLSCLISCFSASLSLAMESPSHGKEFHCEAPLPPQEATPSTKGKEKAVFEESLASSSETPQATASNNTSPSLGFITAERPIATGFFDILDQDRMKPHDTKMKEFERYVQKNQNRYDLILAQLGATYFRSQYINNEQLFKCVSFVREFFEAKIENLNKKAIAFQSHQEQLSQESRETFKFSPIGTYSGKLHENSENQEEYAYQKYKDWDFIYQFVSHFPIPKGSENPIFKKAFKTYIIKNIDSALKGITHGTNVAWLNSIEINAYGQLSKSKVMETFKPLDFKSLTHNIPSLNDMISDKYSLLAYSKKQREKWHERCGIKQKLIEVDELYNKRVSANRQQSGNQEESET
jgi:hypothetical protein